MKIDKGRVKKILVITLSNIGDAILTTPVIQALRKDFPRAHLAVLVGSRAFCVFKDDQRIDKTIIYDKRARWINKLKLMNRLRQDKYDLVVDLRHTAFSIFLGARYHTSIFARAPKSLTHMKDRHLWKLKSLGLNIDGVSEPSVGFSEDEQNNVNQLFNQWQINPALPKTCKSSIAKKDWGILPLPKNTHKLSEKRKSGVKDEQPVVVIAPGARNKTKPWERQGYRQLVERLIKEYNSRIIMVGDEEDVPVVEEIISQVKPMPLNICDKTTLGELAFILTKSNLLVSNDSAPMHLAWAVNTPVVAIFGPTNHKKYAPGGAYDRVIRKELACSPCEQSMCPKGTRQCMTSISAEEVFTACKNILSR